MMFFQLLVKNQLNFFQLVLLGSVRVTSAALLTIKFNYKSRACIFTQGKQMSSSIRWGICNTHYVTSSSFVKSCVCTFIISNLENFCIKISY